MLALSLEVLLINFTLAGALLYMTVNSPAGIVSIYLSDGDYKFDCPRQIIYRGDINLIGSDPSSR